MAVAERCTIVMIITSFRKHKTLVHFLRFSSANGEITRINAKNTAGDTCKVNQEMVAFDGQIYSRPKSTTALQMFSYALRDQSCVLTFSLLSPSLTLSDFLLNPLTVDFQFLFLSSGLGVTSTLPHPCLSSYFRSHLFCDSRAFGWQSRNTDRYN